MAEATATVIKDVDRDRFSRLASGVRNVLCGGSLQDLRRIESILPEIERKRKLAGSTKLTVEACQLAAAELRRDWILDLSTMVAVLILQ